MPDYNLSPNMSLPIPIPGVTAAPNYATYLDNSLTIIDQHNHTSGSGVQITPAALNINSALTMQNNSLTNIQALSLFAQSGAPSTNGSLYLSGVDLYYIDGNGNVVRITQSGSVSGASGTITGLPSGTASASFGAGTFVFQSATSTAANIDGGSLILRNGTASSFGITLSPPNALGSNYSLVLPTIPAQTNLMTIDNAGNMGSVTWNTASNNVTRTTGTSVGVGGVAISSPGSLTTTSPTFVDITNLSVQIATTGNPVLLYMIPQNSSSGSSSFIDTNGAGVIQLLNGSTVIATILFSLNSPDVSVGQTVFYDVPAAGTHTYKLQARSASGTFEIFNYVLFAKEL